MGLFSYTYGDGRTVSADTVPAGDAGISELIFVRDSSAAWTGIRPHMSHPAHEAAVGALPPALRVLRAEGCKLRTWPALPPTIEECYLSGNHYLRVPDLSAFSHLIVLELNDNSIEGVVNPLPPTLARLNLDCNAIRAFNKALVPATCANISTKSNPYDPYFVSFTRQRIAEGQGAAADEPRPANVYVNAHNIHDSGVQKSTKTNILYLVNYRPDVPENPRLWDTIDTAYASTSLRTMLFHRIRNAFTTITPGAELPGTILSSYGKNPYIMHSVTFTRLVDRVWLRIQDLTDAEKKKELMRRFKEEVEDGKSHCTNGMMVRMSNVFLGFDDNIVVKLNANQVLSARIPATQERLRKSMGAEAGPEGNEHPAFWIAVYKETIKDLEDLEEEEDKWGPWLIPLAEPVLDDLFEKQGWRGQSKSSRLPEDVEPDSEAPSLRKHIQSTGLRGFPFEMEYLTSLWA